MGLLLLNKHLHNNYKYTASLLPSLQKVTSSCGFVEAHPRLIPKKKCQKWKLNSYVSNFWILVKNHSIFNAWCKLWWLESDAIFIYISYDLFTLICVIIALNNAHFLLWLVVKPKDHTRNIVLIYRELNFSLLHEIKRYFNYPMVFPPMALNALS